MLAFTSIASLEQFEKFAALLESTLQQVNYKTVFKLDMREILFLCLTKLKLNLSFKCLSVMFSISNTTAASYFNFMIDLLEQCLPIHMPPQEVIWSSVPYCFKKYSITRGIGLQ